MCNSLPTDILGIPKLLPVSLGPQKTKISTIVINKAYIQKNTYIKKTLLQKILLKIIKIHLVLFRLLKYSLH